jgi:hypothetical protein
MHGTFVGVHPYEDDTTYSIAIEDADISLPSTL